MIVKEQKQSEVLTEGVIQESIAMSLDLDSSHFLMQMLSKNLYSDTIGSTIRETVSNALDSHRRAGVTKPIIVGLNSQSDQSYEFTVEDFGIGLNDKDVESIISKYGKSTKRSIENELGMMGIGFKSPLAYCSSFYFVTRKNGVERKYMMYEGENVNTIDLLYETPTKKPSGVKIVVPVRSSDVFEFIDKMKEQLAYFEHVYFDVNIVARGYYNGRYRHSDTISNGFKIFRYDDFQVSELSSDSSMHICLDNVYYPIDFAKLGISEMKIPIGLRFGLNDGLYPTPNRESIRYTPEAKQIIIDKIRKVANYFFTEYNKTIHDSDDVFAVADLFKNADKIVVIEDRTYNITSLSHYTTVKISTPKLKGITRLDLGHILVNDDYLFGEYSITFVMRHGRLSKPNYYHDRTMTIDILKNKDSVICTYKDKLGEIKKEYIKYLYPDEVSMLNKVKFLRKSSPYKLFSVKDEFSYYSILGLERVPRSEWRETIKEFQYLQSLLFKNFVDLDKLDIPQEWLAARRKKPIVAVTSTGKVLYRKPKLKGEIIYKKAVDLERYCRGNNCKFESETCKLEEICKQPFLMIYAGHNDASKMDQLYGILDKKKVKIITLSDREMKLVKDADIHNLISYEDFMKGNNKVFQRAVSAFLIDGLIKTYERVFARRYLFDPVSARFCEQLHKLFNYKEKYMFTNGLSDVYKEMLEVAEKGNLYDTMIHDVYLQVKDTFEKFNFIKLVFRNISWRNEDDMSIILTNLCKYHKFRMDYKNYKHKVVNN